MNTKKALDKNTRVFTYFIGVTTNQTNQSFISLNNSPIFIV